MYIYNGILWIWILRVRFHFLWIYLSPKINKWKIFWTLPIRIAEWNVLPNCALSVSRVKRIYNIIILQRSRTHTWHKLSLFNCTRACLCVCMQISIYVCINLYVPVLCIYVCFLFFFISILFPKPNIQCIYDTSRKVLFRSRTASPRTNIENTARVTWCKFKTVQLYFINYIIVCASNSWRFRICIRSFRRKMSS